MWTYYDFDKQPIFVIDSANIDYAIVSNGIMSDKIGKFYHPEINIYSDSQQVTIIYKKTGDYVYFRGIEALKQLSLHEKMQLEMSYES